MLNEPVLYGIVKDCPDFNCSGQWQVWTHAISCKIWVGQKCDCEISFKTWVKPHDNPSFIQCSECGTSR